MSFFVSSNVKARKGEGLNIVKPAVILKYRSFSPSYHFRLRKFHNSPRGQVIGTFIRESQSSKRLPDLLPSIGCHIFSAERQSLVFERDAGRKGKECASIGPTSISETCLLLKRFWNCPLSVGFALPFYFGDDWLLTQRYSPVIFPTC